MPQAEQVVARELLNTFDKQLKTADGSEPAAEVKQDIVRKVVETFVQTNGALEAAKEGGGLSLGFEGWAVEVLSVLELLSSPRCQLHELR